jgi:DNA-binding response OmpR family regulator
MYTPVVEDDKMQYQFLHNALRESKTLGPLRVVRISTEKGFNDRFEEIAADKPDVILMDIMLRWADPEPNLPLPLAASWD